MDSSRSDLLQVDKAVRAAVTSLHRFRAALEAGKHDQLPPPLEAHRGVSGASALTALLERSILPYETMIRDGLVRWVSTLTESRIDLPLAISESDARRAKSARLNVDPPRMVSYEEAAAGLVASANEAEAAVYLTALADCSPPIAAIERERQQRVLEVRKRVEGLCEMHTGIARGLPLPDASIHAGAEAFLEGTRDLAESMRRNTKRPWSAESAILDALARDACEGLPARPGVRLLEELFAAHTNGLAIVLPKPRPFTGGASLASLLQSWGRAFRQACPAKSLPFVLAHEPSGVADERCGLLFGALPMTLAFQRRVQGASERVAAHQARAMARTALFEARKIATVSLLYAPGGMERFEERGADLFGASIDRRFASVMPTRGEAPDARALALLTLPPFANEMVQRFDEDWFRNPRAFAHLRAHFAGPTREVFGEWDPAKEGAMLARAFEQALG